MKHPNAGRAVILWAAVAAACVLWLGPRAAAAQSFFGGGASATPTPTSASPYLTAPVTLDGQTLFSVATPQDPRKAHLPLPERVADVQAVLAELTAVSGTAPFQEPFYDPQTLRIEVEHGGDVAVLTAVDGTHKEPLEIVTVTSADAGANQQSIDAVAATWQAILQNGLTKALRLREPSTRRHNLLETIGVTAGLALATLLGWLLFGVIQKRTALLSDEVAARAKAASEAVVEQAEKPARSGDIEEGRRRRAMLFNATIDPQQRLLFYRIVSTTLLGAYAVAWTFAVAWALSLFPSTSALSRAFSHGVLVILLITICALVLYRVLHAVAVRSEHYWLARSSVAGSPESARRLQRIPTITAAVSGLQTIVLFFVAVLIALTQLGVPIGSVVTIGGLTAVALSLAVQNFVRDFVNGFLVLAEDQYAVGDYVTLNSNSGVVETLTLRMVQIRDAAGALVTISHSAVNIAVNHSRNWSRVDYRVSVDPGTDTAKALALVRATVEEISRDADWREAILTPVEWIGIDDMNKDSLVIRVGVKTEPLRQFECRRQINERLEEAFAKEGITLGAKL
jgi:small conductance mechanosensitive channel